MKPANALRFAPVVLAPLLASPSGCMRSQLKIDVSVYTGDLVLSESSRIASAVGIARSLRDTCLREAGRHFAAADDGTPSFLVRRNPTNSQSGASADSTGLPDGRRRGAFDFNALGKPNADYIQVKPPNPDDGFASSRLTDRIYVQRDATAGQLLMSLAQFYDNLAIDARYNDYIKSDRVNQENAATTAVTRRRLLDSLTTFAEAAETIGIYIGVVPATFGSIAGAGGINEVIMGVTAEEAGRVISQSIDSINNGESMGGRGRELSSISALMANQAPGIVLTAVSTGYFGKQVQAQYEAKYWKNINQVCVDGSGEVQYMLIKDELGNWHLKQATVDPTRIINAISAVSIATVKIASAAMGVPVPVTQGSSTPSTKDEAADAAEGEADGDASIADILQQLMFDATAAMAGEPTTRKANLKAAIDKAIAAL